ncbi:hypothetical protein BKE30_09550 [Alkanindiges hydrocarboniclasticus]|uniref:Uncharacterized protein n=1 Tax=Alkanindiges hydrocarboniclasticus TaxID=1907941 RepID=A0A1S8CU64_9GAMM|nr:hypothetical protein [Alkanindiges hydrocarboniclasticus]ONG39585.1 hypothetical protein BKE30_09550 [Alkanindiges hydrocarboniclasticus]
MNAGDNNFNVHNADQQAIDKNADKNLPEHPQPNQPQTEGERQQQLQNAHLENQDANVKLPDQHTDNEPEHKEIGSINHQTD